jgi:hypothetical protein
MCKETETLHQKQEPETGSTWREVSWDSANQVILLDTQDGLWHLGPVSKSDMEAHIFKHGSEGTDWRRGTSYGWDKYEGRVIPEEAKELTVDIEVWLDHYVLTHHSELLKIPE